MSKIRGQAPVFFSVAFTIAYWLIMWVGAGFILGALCRVLPGRRGPVKAIPLTLAYALPVGLNASLSWLTQESTANLSPSVLAMLLVLTVTGIVMEVDTFRGERRYWQSRVGLLLSIYQMRYLSLQVAYLAAQVIAMIKSGSSSPSPPWPPAPTTSASDAAACGRMDVFAVPRKVGKASKPAAVEQSW
ncbi:DUF6185 family protein [Streptomyces sp. NPDC059718]